MRSVKSIKRAINTDNLISLPITPKIIVPKWI